jgi:arginyl-tRNA synthetase
MIVEEIRKSIKKALENLSISGDSFAVEHPDDSKNGDYSTNVAMVYGKSQKINPFELSEKIKDELEKVLRQAQDDLISQIEVAKPGFINFHLSQSFFVKSLQLVLNEKENFGKNESLKKQKIVIEYTDPNPFKEFHIGHLMSNAIGESLSRIIEWSGAEVKRACYQGDVGIHVARAIAHKIKVGAEWKTAQDVSLSYGYGSKMYESDDDFKVFVVETNKKVYEKQDEEVNRAYDQGRKLTLEHFEELYKILGTKFDYNFFESTSGEFGKTLVHKNTPSIFVESEGAVVYKGEERDGKLHTRVFINKDGLPTYEAKELGLAKIKYDTYPYDLSLVVTGNEIQEYFKVLLSAMGEIFPDLAKKTRHVPHGMLRLPTGKMSSRTGDVITAESLLQEVKSKVREKIDASDRGIVDKNKLAEEVAVGAIKYSILRQGTGKDIIFDFDKSLSFEGDSGPYLQYTYARACSILEKAKEAKINHLEAELPSGVEVFGVERLVYQFPEVVERAENEFAPHYIATYLIELSASFNNFYAENTIVALNDKESPHRVAITEGVATILKNGLYLLGIESPLKM